MTIRSSSLLGVMCGLSLTLAQIAPSVAQPTPTKEAVTAAEQHYDAGTRLYNLAEYDAAVAEFKEAYKLDPQSFYLFNIAQAYRQKNDCALATTFFKNYLRADPKAKNRAKVEGWIDDMKSCPAVTTITTITPTTPTIGTTPETKPDPIEPADEPAPVATPVTPLPPPPPPPRSAGGGLKLAGLVTAGVGMAALGAGTFFAFRASSRQSDIDAACAGGCVWGDKADLDAQGKTAAARGKIAFAIGGAAVIAGGVMFFMGRSRSHEHAPVALAPTADGAMLVTSGSF